MAYLKEFKVDGIRIYYQPFEALSSRIRISNIFRWPPKALSLNNHLGILLCSLLQFPDLISLQTKYRFNWSE